jgi:CBS domain-containing protein
VKEFAEFLAGQPPFDALGADEVARLAGRAEVEYFGAGAVVLAADTPVEHLWVVRTGLLEVLDRGGLVDLLGPGDTFGQTWLPARRPSGLMLRAREDSLCLRLPDPGTVLAEPERLRFTPRQRPGDRLRLTDDTAVRTVRRLADVLRPVVWSEAGEAASVVADRIGQAGTSCALVRFGDDGVGIVTDHDFRRLVASGSVDPRGPVGPVATVPALTIEVDAAPSAALLRMIEQGVHHLVVTDGGRPVGVVRVVDLGQAEARDPLLLRAAIAHATTLDDLAAAARMLPAMLVELCDAAVDATRIGTLHAAVVDAIVRRALELHHDPVLAETRPAWVLLGSLARREPLPLSDLDTALVWADPPAGGSDPGPAIRTSARDLLRDLERCGLVLCANGANAHNPQFSRSRSGWIAAARGWQADPSGDRALLLSAMVADSRPLTDAVLGRSLTEAIRSHTRTTQFLRALLDSALAFRPPLGFVRDFVVQHSGEHRGELDLKRGGLAPVVGLARWIAIAAGDPDGTTPQRLHRGAELGLLSTDEAQTLAGGFAASYALLMRHEVEAVRAGGQPSTFIAPKGLDTLSRRHLRESFRAISAVQTRVDRDWIARLDR